MFSNFYHDDRPSAADTTSPAPVTEAADSYIRARVDIHSVSAGIETSLDGVGLLAAALLSTRVRGGTLLSRSVSRSAGW